MGVFGQPQPCGQGEMGKYNTTTPGANFGGTCVDAACASKQECGGRIAANLGKVSGNPFAVDTRCPCCEKAFRADRMWFYGCHVVLRRLPPNADLVFDVAGAEMRVVELNHDNREADCISFAAT